MRRIRYAVAMSLDGCIAGPRGEADWIVIDPAIDFVAFASEFDTLLVGGGTFETMARARRTTMPGMKTVVVSTTIRREDHPEVEVIGRDAERAIAALREGPDTARDIWLFGGAELFRRLLEAGLVDTVEVKVEPILLGGGIRLLPSPAGRAPLTLAGHRVYPSGVVSLEYAVGGPRR
jgi:dihydrofolate reductase